MPKKERNIPKAAIWAGRWVISCLLLNRDTMVYNGLAETEIPKSKIKIPKNIKTYYF